MSGINICRKFF